MQKGGLSMAETEIQSVTTPSDWKLRHLHFLEVEANK